MTDPNSTLPPPLPPRPAAKSFGEQLGFTIFFALVLAFGLFVIRHGRLPGMDQPLLSAAGSATPAAEATARPGSTVATYPSSLSAPPAVPANPSTVARPILRTAAPVTVTGANWTQQACADLIFEAPVNVAPSQPPKEFPASMMRYVEFMNWWRGKSDERLYIIVGVLRIDGQHTLSFEDGVRGGTTAMRNSGAIVDDPGFNPPPLWVSGCIARRISGTHMSSHGPVRSDMIMIQRRRESMIISVVYTDERRNDAMRILNSLQVRGGANG